MSRPQFTAPSATTRIEARSTVEVNADQTQTLSPGQAQTSRIRADTGEIWELRGLRLSAPANGTGATVETHEIVARSEAQGIEVVQATADYSTEAIRYLSGQWIEPTNNVRQSDRNPKINAANGLEIRYDLLANANADQTGTREIRASFDVVKS
jgi:hypothetical protein